MSGSLKLLTRESDGGGEGGSDDAKVGDKAEDEEDEDSSAAFSCNDWTKKSVWSSASRSLMPMIEREERVCTHELNSCRH